MRSSRTRSLLVSAFVLALAGLGWFYLAPTQIGGSTHYVITHGVSMEPLLHTGDLVLVRPSDNYRVGQVVAYHSTLLHTVVLHRIIRIQHGHYFFKGDNNSFVDPTHPTRRLLIGSMWVHIANGGVLLGWLHTPWVAAVLLGAVAAFLLFGGGRRRRRRDRGRRQRSGSSWPRSVRPVTSATPHSASRTSNHDLFVACTVGAVLFAVLCVVAFALPADNTVVVRQSYTQTLRFSYRSTVPPSPVYPSGTVATGDPVYLSLVHLLSLTAAYRLTTSAPHRLHGTIGMRATLSNSSGWSRSFWLARPNPFVGASARTTALINLSRFESLANRISTQIGGTAGGSYTLAVTPHVKIAGRIAAQPMSATYSPTLDLGIGTSQLLGGSSVIGQSSSIGTPGSSSGSALGLVHSTPSAATTAHSSTNTIAGVPVEVIRWLALLALALCAWGAWRFHQRERENPPEPAERISGRYKHLIVPVEPITPDPDHPPIEVSSIEALAQLAERSERLILHDRQADVDNYLIDDQGTLYRFSASRVNSADMNGAVSTNGTAGTEGDGHDDSGIGTGDHAADREDLSAAGPGGAPDGSGGAGISSPGGIRPSVPSGPGLSYAAADAAAATFRSAAAAGDLTGHEAAGAAGGPTPSDPSADPVESADAAEIIFRSAAARLSAAAAKGTAESPGEGDAGTSSGPDRRSGADRRAANRRDAADRRGAADRADAPRAAADGDADARTTSGEEASSRPRPRPRPRAAETTEVSSRSVPDLLVFDGDPHQPPVPASPHWSRRPAVRAGFAIGPLALTFLAWRRERARRRRLRGDDAGESKRRSWTSRNLSRR
jgi:signal peptidase I